jgi:hypothetical protein
MKRIVQSGIKYRRTPQPAPRVRDWEFRGIKYRRQGVAPRHSKTGQSRASERWCLFLIHMKIHYRENGHLYRLVTLIIENYVFGAH